MRVRVAIPHFFHPSGQAGGYGSTRAGTSQAQRSLALGRCLHSLLAQRRQPQDLVLNQATRELDQLPDPHPMEPLDIEIIVCMTGDRVLQSTLELFRGKIQHRSIALNNPKFLPLATRDALIHHPKPADLSVYLEDDLIFHDALSLDKLSWFLKETQGQAVLMPHRYEAINRQGFNRLYVDGALKAHLQLRDHITGEEFVRLEPKPGQIFHFERASNPHSGMFAINEQQRQELQQQPLPTKGFVGPLETAATLTVAAHYPIYKPSFDNRYFLEIEHGHPSYLYTLNKLKINQTTNITKTPPPN